MAETAHRLDRLTGTDIMSYVPPQYTPYVYTMHNVRALDTHFPDLLDAHHCADYLQSDARGEILMPT